MLLRDIPYQSKIKCGKFYLPASMVEQFCAKSVRKLLSKQIGDDRFFGEQGSVTLVKSTKYLAVLTAHQLGNPDYSTMDSNFSENFIIPSLRSKIKNLPVKSLIYCTDNEDEDFRDVVCYELDVTDEDFKKERVHFYPIKPPTGAKIHYHFYVGFPRISDNSVYSPDGCELTEIKNRVLIKNCVLDKSFVSDARFLKKYDHNLNSIPVDGLSGGAVFVLVESAEGFEVCLDSIIVRGNSDYLHGISVEYLSMIE